MDTKLNPSAAIVVLSGGQDSTTCLYWAKLKFDTVYAVSFDYGQRHIIELDCAVKIAIMAGVQHEVINVRNLLNSSSPLTSSEELEKYADYDSMAAKVGTNVERTFVPMRNTLFLTIAANRAIELGAGTIVTGICGEDNANYPDCTNPFKLKLQAAFHESLFGERYADKPMPLQIAAPLMHMSKAETVRLAVTLPGCMEALAYSHTSYDGKYPPTDMNHSNILRAKGFEVAGVPDPLVLRAWAERVMELPETANYDKCRNGETYGYIYSGSV